MSEYFQFTIHKIGDMYQVPLPWKHNADRLRNNEQVSRNQGQTLMRQLEKSQKLMGEYDKAIPQYLVSGVVEQVTQAENRRPVTMADLL